MSETVRTYPLLATAAFPVRTRKRPGRPRETRDLPAMAAVYNAAYATGHPTRAVRAAYPHYGKRTVTAKIARARQLGLITAPIPPAGRPRKAA
jgi:hypothetical protein